MDSTDRATARRLMLVYLLLLSFSFLQTQEKSSVCDVTQYCSCCLTGVTCSAKTEYWCDEPCKEGFWGAKCIQKCPANCISCDQSYGQTNVCNKCVLGRYGINCSENCPVNCFNETCDKASGSCLKCKPGYYGSHCTNTCSKSCLHSCQTSNGYCHSCAYGHYGNKCERNCSGNCQQTCDRSTGYCDSCVDGQYGNSCELDCSKNCKKVCNKSSGYCDSCKTGFYGHQCNMTCSPNCAGNVCDQDTGTCSDGCRQNFNGEFCNYCISGKYGNDCSMTCSSGCRNDSCEGEQGSCTLGCKEGYSDSQYCCTDNTHCSKCHTSSTCAECANGTYGCRCDKRCSSSCNGSCDMFTGICRSCLPGHHGDFCESLCSKFCRHNVCIKSDGECVNGCTNNSTAKDCREEISETSENMSSESKECPAVGVAAGVASFAVVALVIVAVLFYRRRRGHQNRKEETIRVSKESSTVKDNSGADLVYQNTSLDSPTTDRYHDIGQIGGNKLDVPYANENEKSITNPYYNAGRDVNSPTRVTLDRLRELMSKSAETIGNEFDMLPKGLTKPHVDASKPKNLTRNRYKTVYPYDENRVRVIYENSDYINASFIDGFEKSRAYIAALGPTEKTIGDFAVFWKMVWQEKVEVIVMLTRLVESSGMKCVQYWPDNGSVRKYADISIQCDHEEVFAEFTVRQLLV